MKLRKKMAGIICTCNVCSDDEDDEIGTCILKPGGQCFSAVEQKFNRETGNYEEERTFGCFSSDEESLLQCHGDLVPSYYWRSIKCCNFTDECNKSLLPPYKPRNIIANITAYKPPSFQIIEYDIVALSVYIFVFCIAVGLAIGLRSRKRRQSRVHLTENLFKTENSECGIPSQSGAGKPILIPLTIGREFIRKYCLERGSYTEFYVGDWSGAEIMEKVFTTSNEKPYFIEKQIYEIAHLSHKNILGYIAFDILNHGQRTLYLDYHKNGFLDIYLDRNSLNIEELFSLIKSLMRGVSYLHSDFGGIEKRPTIAHRNITSKNILINNNKECVISNFEIAVMYDSTKDIMIGEPDDTLGTPRYLAPEILSNISDTRSFDSFKMADIYSTGLVLYEICQKYSTEQGTSRHFLPFSNVLSNEPTIEDMKILFHQEPVILLIQPLWERNDVFKSAMEIVEECFYLNPKARPTALRLKKSLSAFIEQVMENNL